MPREQNSPLLELPIELLLRVADCISCPDLLNLRAASKDLAVCLAKQVGRRCFSLLEVLIRDEASMLNLVNICQHPVYSKHVLRIKFDTVRLKYEVPYGSRNNGRFGFGHRQPHTREQRAQQRDRRRAYHAAVDEQEKFMQGPALEALHVALRSLVAFNKGRFCPSIEVGGTCIPLTKGNSAWGPGHRTVSVRHVHAWGAQKLRRRLGYQDCFPRAHQELENKAHEMVLSAIKDTGYKTRTLALGVEDQPLYLFSLYDAFDDVLTPFRCLSRLDLVFQASDIAYSTETEEAAQQRIRSHMTLLMWMIAQADRLKSLRLRTLRNLLSNRQWDSTSFHMLAQGTFESMPRPLSKLRDLELEGHGIEPATLLDFVASRSKTLRRLTLRDIDDDGQLHPDIEREINQAYGKDGLQLKLERVYKPET